MKSLFSQLSLVLSLSVAASAAQAECYITTYGSCPQKLVNGILSDQFLEPWDANANVNPNRCLQRAREFLSWCGPGTTQVVAAFKTNKVYKIGVVVDRAGSRFLSTDQNGNLVGLQSGY